MIRSNAKQERRADQHVKIVAGLVSAENAGSDIGGEKE